MYVVKGLMHLSSGLFEQIDFHDVTNLLRWHNVPLCNLGFAKTCSFFIISHPIFAGQPLCINLKSCPVSYRPLRGARSEACRDRKNINI